MKLVNSLNNTSKHKYIECKAYFISDMLYITIESETNINHYFYIEDSNIFNMLSEITGNDRSFKVQIRLLKVKYYIKMQIPCEKPFNKPYGICIYGHSKYLYKEILELLTNQ